VVGHDVNVNVYDRLQEFSVALGNAARPASSFPQIYSSVRASFHAPRLTGSKAITEFPGGQGAGRNNG
jgi:hypothetical protein